MYILKNIFKVNYHAITTQDKKQNTASIPEAPCTIPRSHSLTSHGGDPYSNYWDNNILVFFYNLILHISILKIIQSSFNCFELHINRIMLSASFYDLLLQLHVIHPQSDQLFPSFSPLCRILLVEYTMVEFNHSMSILIHASQGTCSIIFPRHCLVRVLAGKKICNLR